jgi:hypothetical protein
MSKLILDALFQSSQKCKENDCCLDNGNILNIYKPDNGLRDMNLLQGIFGHTNQVKMCDCVVVNSINEILLIEIKCGTVTKSILHEVIEQISNTAMIIQSKNILFNKIYLIYKRLDNVQLRKEIDKIRIYNKTLKVIQYKNGAIVL